MTKEELDAIPDDVWVEAHDLALPNLSGWLARDKIASARSDRACQPIARLIMQVRALKAQLPEQVDPDLLALRDRFAGQCAAAAMVNAKGITKEIADQQFPVVAGLAYQMADAMLAAREQSQ